VGCIGQGGVQEENHDAYREPGSLGDYELDHLVPLEVGGSNGAGNL